MQAFHVSLAFCTALLLSLAIKLWLASRQMRHVHAHRAQVPAPFDATIPLDAHQRAADYTIARTRFGMLSESFSTAVLVGWTLLGGLDALNTQLRNAVLPWGGEMVYQLALFGAFGLISALLEMPLEWYKTFRIEQHFGFNRMSLGLFLGDQAKGLLVGGLVGLPLLAAVLWVMQATGSFWWLWAWALWTGFMLLMQVLYPTVIAPLFSRFTPLAELGRPTLKLAGQRFDPDNRWPALGAQAFVSLKLRPLQPAQAEEPVDLQHSESAAAKGTMGGMAWGWWPAW